MVYQPSLFGIVNIYIWANLITTSRRNRALEIMVYYKGNHPFYGLDFQVSMIIYPDYILFGSGTCQTLFQDICGTHDLSHVRKCATKSYWSAYISEYVSTEDVLTEYVRLYVKHIRPRVCHDKCIHIFRMYVFQCVRTIFKVHVNKNHSKLKYCLVVWNHGIL